MGLQVVSKGRVTGWAVTMVLNNDEIATVIVPAASEYDAALSFVKKHWSDYWRNTSRFTCSRLERRDPRHG